MDRRSFLSWVGVGLLASSLPVAIAACSAEQENTPPETAEPPPPPPEAIAREDGFVAVGPTQALETDGSMKGEAGGIPVVIAKDPADATKYIAVSSTCTHNGCAVAWEAGEGQFECPCHDSHFKADGGVAKGPATKPLQAFEVKIEEDVVLVKPA